ncbi:hypothetical protein [Saliniradius amylolyticus]|nr:hypothetical protein [Saliniradius amylolyticus]
METLIEKIRENMQVIYRRALDADDKLAQLNKQGKGKFQQVFADDAGFEAKSKRFMPYVEELGKDVLALEQVEDQQQAEQQLAKVVSKMEQLFSTLSHFQESLK